MARENDEVAVRLPESDYDSIEVDEALGAVGREIARAVKQHPGAYTGPHHGWAVIFEEVDELWDEVRKKKPDPGQMRHEALQVAATAIRFVLDVCRACPNCGVARPLGDPCDPYCGGER